ncbi:MAG: beta-ketoacyl synthase N-terminal-like domain-containing protein, partial [Planctomycetota bacterium]
GVIEGAEYLDAKFFNIPPREAELIDPQQRIMLELCWTALEDAGCIPSNFDGSIGVWAGTYETGYVSKNILSNPEIVDEIGEFQIGVYNEKDYIATRVAHRLDLKGPAINVNTACSTSLVAIIEACKSLKEGHCDAALAGGVSVHFPQYSGHLYQEGSIFSPDGHCRPFDAKSAGTLFSDGAGVVVLKRLQDAIDAGDQIYAVVRGYGINNDGGNKASFSAPSIEGQAEAIAMAHESAELESNSIGYVEAHGTATPIGDPIEVAALTRAFSATTNEKQFCAIGSVKSNVGHTVAAAGVTGFIKATLSLHHQKIPATLHFNQPNPQIDFAATPFFVCDKLTEWPRSEQPRRAGVSSFGVGGTNAHVVIEEAPPMEIPLSESNDNFLFTVSAKKEEALGKAKNQLATSVTDQPNRLCDIANTLNTGRHNFRHRGFCIANTPDELAKKFQSERGPDFVSRKADGQRQVVFMFPGQGSQYIRMGQNLYERLPGFKKSLDTCCDILEPLLNKDIRAILFPPAGDEEAAQGILKKTQFTQPALFSIGYSLAQTLILMGVKPTAMIGHSIGEFAAACCAGVFSLEDGLRFIAKRGELMQSLPGGSMMSVRLPGAAVEPMIHGQLAIAAYNGPKLSVVAGPDEEVLELQSQLESEHVACKFLQTSHAFHSPMMDSIVDPFAKFIAEYELEAPQIPIHSTVTGTWMRDEEATDPGYWAEHSRQPVRFSDAISSLWNEDPDLILVELGPRKTLATLAKQHAADRKKQISIPTMSDSAVDQLEWKTFLTAIGNLWTYGVDLDLSRIQTGKSRKVSLPTYPFQRKKYFVEPRTAKLTDHPLALNQPPIQNINAHPVKPVTQVETPPMKRTDKITEVIHEVFESSSGIELSEFESDTTFFEMGLDSLVLTQTATSLKREFGVEVTFRQLLEQTPNVISLAEFLDAELPADRFAVETNIEPVVSEAEVGPEPATCQASTTAPNVTPAATLATAEGKTNEPAVSLPTQQPYFGVTNFTVSQSGATESIIQNQLQIM